jgi:3-oxoacyl-[acyl-carrier-protein] synthase-3
VTAETYSKYIHERDRATRSIFGDGAAATLVEKDDASRIGPFIFGTDGSGADNLCVKTFGLRHRGGPCREYEDDSGNIRSDDNLFMDGPEIFTFTLNIVPSALDALLAKAGVALEDVDYFVFHQANVFMLEHLKKKIKIPSEKFPIMMEETGNTVSSTIPIVLEGLIDNGDMGHGSRVVLMGFGGGYSWGAAVLGL